MLTEAPEFEGVRAWPDGARPSPAARLPLPIASDLSPVRTLTRRWQNPGQARTVVTAEVYRRDLRLRVSVDRPRPPQAPPKTRNIVRGFSPAAAKRLRLLVRNTYDLWTGFLTLTYPGQGFPTDGKKVKQQLHAFTAWLRRNKVAYVWVLEFQERGAPHFHFLLRGWVKRDLWECDGQTFQASGNRKAGISGADARRMIESGRARQIVRGLESEWHGLVGDGQRDNYYAGTGVEAVKNPDEVGIYMAKYMGKLSQKEVPSEYVSVGRFWGASKCVSTTIYRMRGLYRDVAVKNLQVLRTLNRRARCSWAARYAAEAEAETYPPKKLKLEARAWSYAEPWEWKGYGFTFISGADAFRSILRQAVRLDAGNSWHPCSLLPRRKPKLPDVAPLLAGLERVRRENLETNYPGGAYSYDNDRRNGALPPDYDKLDGPPEGNHV